MTNSFNELVAGEAAASPPTTIPKAAHATAKPTTTNTSAKAGVHVASGVPDALQPVIRYVSPFKAFWSDAERAQAQLKDDSHQDQGRQSVAHEASGKAQASRHIAAVVGLSIDLASLRGEDAKSEKTRKYIGASSIAEPCHAYLALSMRGFPSTAPSAQLIRIFNQGHAIETLVVDTLIAAGHNVEPVDLATGKQWGYASHGGHHRAHLDGFITLAGDSERMTLEIKSMNRKSFDSFVKKGVQLSHPHYYAQCVDGLGLARIAKVDVNNCFFIAHCKDNSQYHCEVIGYNSTLFGDLTSKVARVTGGESERTGSHVNEYTCGQCFKRDSCWKPNVTERDCSHCTHSAPAENRGWLCKLTGNMATQTCSSFSLFKPTKMVTR
jgi:hypothetical protein